MSTLCKKCGTTYDDVAVNFRRGPNGNYRSPCLPCQRAKAREWKANHPEAVLRIQSERQAKKSAREIEADRRRSAERYRLKHGEALEANRRYHRANREIRNAKSREYYRAHKAEHERRRQAWKAANPFLASLALRNARGRSRAIANETFSGVTTQQLAARIAYYGGKCWMCGADWQEIDHLIPLSRGGPHIPANIRPACSWCNRHKHAKRPSEMSA